MTSPHRLILASTVASALFLTNGNLSDAPMKVETVPLSPEVRKAHDGYASMLEALRDELKLKLLQIDAANPFYANTWRFSENSQSFGCLLS